MKIFQFFWDTMMNKRLFVFININFIQKIFCLNPTILDCLDLQIKQIAYQFCLNAMI